jgi:hypothetical protein
MNEARTSKRKEELKMKTLEERVTYIGEIDIRRDSAFKTAPAAVVNCYVDIINGEQVSVTPENLFIDMLGAYHKVTVKMPEHLLDNSGSVDAIKQHLDYIRVNVTKKLLENGTLIRRGNKFSWA